MLQTTLRVGMSRAGNLQMRGLESHTPMGLIGWDTPNGPKESMDLGSPMDSFYKGQHIQFLGQMVLGLTWLMRLMETLMAHSKKGHFGITLIGPDILKIRARKSMRNQQTGNHSKIGIAVTTHPLINKTTLLEEHLIQNSWTNFIKCFLT